MNPSFDEVLSHFRDMLDRTLLPRGIVWIAPEHTIFLGHEWKIYKGECIEESDIAARYEAARLTPLGVRFGVLCTDGVKSYCYLYIPTDDVDAEYKLLSNGCVKLSIPHSVPHASLIDRGVCAMWYRLMEIRTKKWKEGLFGIG